MQRISAFAVALVAGLFVSSARAEDFVVVESSVPAVKVGTEVSATAGLSVPANARVVLLRADGQMVTVNGPFQGVPVATPPGAADSRLFVAITSLVRASAQEDSVRVAAVRDVTQAARAARSKTVRDIMAIDTTEGGDSCLYDPAAAELIRDPASRAGSVSILSTASAGSATLTWPAGSPLMAWPKDVPLVDGGSYLIQEDGHSGAAITTIHLLMARPGNTDLQQIAELVEHGCTSQAKLWLRMITADQRK